MKNKGRNRRKAVASNAKLVSTTIKCTVCSVGDGKYKCPKCRAPFCCVQCSKDHKANLCSTTSDTLNNSKDDAKAQLKDDIVEQKSQYVPSAILKSSQIARKRNRTSEDDRLDSDDDEPGFNITPEMKKRLEQSTWLRNELQDGGLRYLIGSIDAAADDYEDNNDKYNDKKGRGNTTNEGITPQILALARNKHSHPKFATFIDQMLLTAGVLQPVEGTDVDGQLSLVPIPRRGDMDLSENDSEKSSTEESCSGSTETSDSDENEVSSDDSTSSGGDEKID